MSDSIARTAHRNSPAQGDTHGAIFESGRQLLRAGSAATVCRCFFALLMPLQHGIRVCELGGNLPYVASGAGCSAPLRGYICVHSVSRSESCGNRVAGFA